MASVHGSWRSDAAVLPLTQPMVKELWEDKLFFDIQSQDFPEGEIRGRIVRQVPDNPQNAPAAVPLPSTLGAAGMGLFLVGCSARAGKRDAQRRQRGSKN